MTTQAVNLEMVLELPDPVFQVAAVDVDVVIQFLGTTRQVGEHKTPVFSLTSINPGLDFPHQQTS
jgi:hypothetical protein